MNRALVDNIVFAIVDDLTALINAILEDDSISTNDKVNLNTLAGSNLQNDLAATIATVTGGDPVISALFNHYVVYIEWDRPPEYGKRPPISALKDWAARRGIPTDASTLYAISYAIWRDGHKGRPIFQTMDKNLDELFVNDWADKLFNAISSDLDNKFND